MKKLSEVEIQELLRREPDWALAGGMLVRDWQFESFAEAMAFVNQVAALAEKADHHPDIDIRYNKVHLALESHDAGGLTRRDDLLTAEIGEIPQATRHEKTASL